MSAEEFDAAGIQRLPRSLHDAVEMFDNDDFIKDVIGEQMHTSYSQYKHDEIIVRRHDQSCQY